MWHVIKKAHSEWNTQAHTHYPVMCIVFMFTFGLGQGKIRSFHPRLLSKQQQLSLIFNDRDLFFCKLWKIMLSSSSVPSALVQTETSWWLSSPPNWFINTAFSSSSGSTSLARSPMSFGHIVTMVLELQRMTWSSERSSWRSIRLEGRIQFVLIFYSEFQLMWPWDLGKARWQLEQILRRCR